MRDLSLIARSLHPEARRSPHKSLSKEMTGYHLQEVTLVAWSPALLTAVNFHSPAGLALTHIQEPTWTSAGGM